MFIAPSLPPSSLLWRQVALGLKGGIVVHWGVPPALGCTPRTLANPPQTVLQRQSEEVTPKYGAYAGVRGVHPNAGGTPQCTTGGSDFYHWHDFDSHEGELRNIHLGCCMGRGGGMAMQLDNILR